MFLNQQYRIKYTALKTVEILQQKKKLQQDIYNLKGKKEKGRQDSVSLAHHPYLYTTMKQFVHCVV